jgi:hypothetical protein
VKCNRFSRICYCLGHLFCLHLCFQFRFKLTSWVQVILKRQLYIQISVAVKYVPMLVILVRPIIEVNKSLVLIHFFVECVPWTSRCTHILICVFLEPHTPYILIYVVGTSHSTYK